MVHFPTDPYSIHRWKGCSTARHDRSGKEDLISRFGELGVCVKEGKLTFAPRILRNEEFLSNEGVFEYVNIGNEVDSVKVPKDWPLLTVKFLSFMSAQTSLKL